MQLFKFVAIMYCYFLISPRDLLRGSRMQQLVPVTGPGYVTEGVREGARLRSAEVI